MVDQAPRTATYAIEARGISKRYGKASVFEDINLCVRPGEVFALTGPNGAGKTTLIKTITGLAFPSSGEVFLGGLNIHTNGQKARASLGAVVESPAKFYTQFTGTQNLQIHANLAAMSAGEKVGRERIREVLAQLELTRMSDRKVSEYSLGQRQRLGVASAVLANPKVLILDEPTSGLDPLGIGLIHRIVTSLAASGCAVILSTHHLREISTYAHTVGILSGGRMVDTIDLRQRHASYRFKVDNPSRAVSQLETLPFVIKAGVRSPYAVVQLSDSSHVPELMQHLAKAGLLVYEASPDHFDLYEYYRDRLEKA